MYKYLFFIITIISCNSKSNSKIIVNTSIKKDTIKAFSIKELQNKKDTIDYDTAKKQIALIKNKLKEDLDKNIVTLDSVKKVFNNLLLNKVIPYWYGTTWSFNGHTNKPNQGETACGYFVSTTLKHMGLNLNRYKLAQKAPKDEAHFLSCGMEVLLINGEFKSVIKKIKKNTSDGMYFIGFNENHVGYLLNNNDRLFLIHSNYLVPSKVIIEPIEKSSVFKSFEKYYIIPLSNNDKLINKWLNNINL